MTTAIRWSSILLYKEKETHAFWNFHLKISYFYVIDFSNISSPTVQSMFLLECVIYRGFNCVLNPLNFPVNRFGNQFHRKSKFKWLSRNYWKEEYWVSEKRICERELGENKIQKNSYRFWIEKNCNNDI